MGAHRLDTLRTRRVLGGLLVQDLARRANVTDLLIDHIESGGACQPEVTQRILDALGPPAALATNTQANPTVFT
jgi:predicted transcriptional regulator